MLLSCGGRRVVVLAVKIVQASKKGRDLEGKQARARKPKIQTVFAQRFAHEIKSKGSDMVLFVVQERQQGKPVGEMPHSPDRTRLNQLLHEYADVLVEELPTGLPPGWAIDHRIELTEGNHQPPHKPCYKMSPLELQEAHRQVEEYLQKGYIRPSVSPYGAPILFIRKKNGKLRMYIDYRALNNITKRNNFPIPQIDELLENLRGARYFSKLDLASGYHQTRIMEADIPKTALNTRYGHYEWLVMCFGLTNVPSMFQGLMNEVFRDLIGQGFVVYLDDILAERRRSILIG